MPAGATWGGVYQGPYHIMLNVWTRGAQASGNWRAVGDREGEFSGTVSGNLLVLDWSEHAVGNAETWSGRGYFVYRAGQPGKPPQIYGEWGMGTAEHTNSWWAVKRSDQAAKDSSEQIDKDADQQYLDESGCEGCDTNDTDGR